MTSSNAVQQFVAPAGATRLFLGVMHAYGYVGNSGIFSVDVASVNPNDAPTGANKTLTTEDASVNGAVTANVSAGQNIQSSGGTAPATPATSTITFTADGLTPVEIAYTPDGGNNSAVLSGFELTGKLDFVPNPTGTILNDDAATVSTGDASVTEGGNLEFIVSLNNPVDVDTVITYSTADGSATTGDSDYTSQTLQTLTIPAGQISGMITVATTADNKVELDETMTVELTGVNASGRNVTIDDGSGQGTIENDDFAPDANAGGPYEINEGDSLTLDARGSTDVDDGFAGLTFRWDIDGDGDFDESVTGANPTLNRELLALLGLADGFQSHLVTVEANDGTNTDTAVTTLTINNVAPAITELNSGNSDVCNAVSGQCDDRRCFLRSGAGPGYAYGDRELGRRHASDLARLGGRPSK